MILSIIYNLKNSTAYNNEFDDNVFEQFSLLKNLYTM